MIVREDREKLKNCIKKYRNGTFSNFQFADAAAFASKDMLVREIEAEVDFFLSDFSPHYCEGEKLKEVLSRFVLILESDYELPTDYSPRIYAEGNIFVRIIKVILNLVKTNFVVLSHVSSNIYWPLKSPKNGKNWSRK